MQTIKELREFIKDLPDDMEINYYNDIGNPASDFTFIVDDEENELKIYAD